MAQAVFCSLSEKNNLPFTAQSAGLAADEGSPVSANAKNALLEDGINFSHTSVQVNESMIKNAFMVFGITERHASTLITSFPQYSDKIFAFPDDIPDPFMGSPEVYRKCLCRIKDGVGKIIEYLTKESKA